MTRVLRVPKPPSAELQDLAAELTEAAYPIALSRRPGERWLEVQLDLWHAMEQTVEKWQQSIVKPQERRALA